MVREGGVSRLEATWTKLEIWGETGDKRPSKWTRGRGEGRECPRELGER